MLSSEKQAEEGENCNWPSLWWKDPLSSSKRTDFTSTQGFPILRQRMSTASES